VHIAAVLNLTPDHLDYHGSLEGYAAAKRKIFLNQTAHDWAVLNWDDPLVRSFRSAVRGKIMPFSRREELNPGVYVREHEIFVSDGRHSRIVCPVEEIRIPGLHNLESVLWKK